MSTDVVVVIGVGGIGQAIARRQGFGKRLESRSTSMPPAAG